MILTDYLSSYHSAVVELGRKSQEYPVWGWECK